VRIKHPADKELEVPRAAKPPVSAFSGALLLVLVAVMFWSGCGGGSSTGGDPLPRSTLATISVLPSAATIQVGSTKQLQATAKDQNGNAVAGITFAFSSSDGAATVSGTGLVKGASAGTATITASAGGKNTSVSITVTDPPAPQPVLTQISVSPSTASIGMGQNQSYIAVGYDQFNNVMNGITFAWASDGGSVATINGNVATGVSSGTVHVTASASGVSSAPASLTVLPPPPVLTTIAVTPAAPSIFTGGTQQLTAVGYDQSGNPMSGIAFAWSSANQNVATVDGTGLAHGVSAGTSQISASAQGVNSNAITLTVNRAPSVLTSIDVTPSSASIPAGNTQAFAAAGYDQYGSVMTGIVLTWSSSVTSVASVNGLIPKARMKE
jgi:hypothetical protein